MAYWEGKKKKKKIGTLEMVNYTRLPPVNHMPCNLEFKNKINPLVDESEAFSSAVWEII